MIKSYYIKLSLILNAASMTMRILRKQDKAHKNARAFMNKLSLGCLIGT